MSPPTGAPWSSQTQRERKQWVPGLGGGEFLFSGDRVPVWEGDKVLEMGGVAQQCECT